MTGRKKRDTFDVRENLYNLRNKLIRTGRNDDETTMIREAVDDAIDKIIENGIDERDTDIEAIKEQIFLEVASRLEESKITSQNEIIKEAVQAESGGGSVPTRIIGEPASFSLAESVSSTTISTSTTEDNRPVKEATLYSKLSKNILCVFSQKKTEIFFAFLFQISLRIKDPEPLELGLPL